MKGLRWWVALRLTVPLAVVVAVPSVRNALASAVVAAVPNIHGQVKGVLFGWQSLVLRRDMVLVALVIGAVVGVVLPRLRGRTWAGAAIGSVAVLCLVIRPVVVPVGLALLLVNAWPWTLPRGLAWLPGVELFFPLPLARCLRLTTATPGTPAARFGTMYAAIAGAALSMAFIVSDIALGFSAREFEVVATPWPASRVDSRVKTLDVAPPGVRSEFHDVDIVRDHAVVVAETTLRLLATPSLASAALSAQWGPQFGLAMDSETDPDTDITWFLSGPNVVNAAHWSGSIWEPAGHSPPIPAYLHHVYTHRNTMLNLLVLLTVGTRDENDPPRLVTLSLPDLATPTVTRLRTANGEAVPMPRDFEWIAPLRRYAIAPDMGDALWLLDPQTGLTARWISAPTLDGRPTWDEVTQRLYVPLPSRMEVWAIDVKSGAIQVLPSEPGVRTIAVDGDRGLYLTGSVITGAVDVRKLSDGSRVDRFAGLMPMMRLLVLGPGRGVATLTTWTALYEIPYAGG